MKFQINQILSQTNLLDPNISQVILQIYESGSLHFYCKRKTPHSASHASIQFQFLLSPNQKASHMTNQTGEYHSGESSFPSLIYVCRSIRRWIFKPNGRRVSLFESQLILASVRQVSPQVHQLGEWRSARLDLLQYVIIRWISDPTVRRSKAALIKKEKKMFLIYKEIQSGAVAKSYMRKGFLIYEEMRKYFPIYDEVVSHIWLWNCSTLNFRIYEVNLIFFFISVHELPYLVCQELQ